MILPYSIRLLCLCLASFFLVQLALGVLVSTLTPAILRTTREMAAGPAARRILFWRFLPGGMALLVVVTLCIPSFLSLEEDSGSEYAGYLCLVLAALCVTVWAISTGRVMGALTRSRRYAQDLRRMGHDVVLPGEQSPVCVIEGSVPFLALSGILRPAVLVSQPVVNALGPELIAAALRHERAHRVSRDNFKRFCLVAAPEFLPFVHGFRRLEREWVKLAEWAADDRAVAGDASCSLSLAEALVRMARLGLTSSCSPLASPFVTTGADIAERVDRLLNTGATTQTRDNQLPAILSAITATAFLVGLFVTRAATLESVHELLERLLR